MDSKKAPLQKRTTLGDIADRAGVSVSTVSVVLANKAKERRISEDVFQRVQQAAIELDYSPNLLVRSMQRGRTHVLSFSNGFRYRSLDDLYMDRLTTAIEREAGERGYDLLMHCCFKDSADENYRVLNGGRTDGLLLFAPPHNDLLLPYLKTSRLPIVLINSWEEDGLLTNVKDDTEDGMRQVAERLAALGHRRIAAISDGAGANPDAPRRIALLQKFLARHNISIPEDWICPAKESKDCAVILRYLMDRKQPPTALFCWHDNIGYLALDACDELGIEVPRRLSLVGYDGLRWPTVTGQILDSVHVDLNRLAETAVRFLDGLINGKEVPKLFYQEVTLTSGATLSPVCKE